MQTDSHIQIRPLTLSHREILLRMYRSFEPLGLALGLPPRNEEGRETWIDRALQKEVNIGAFSPAGGLLGHSFLARSGTGEAEIAFFVQQGHRRRGIGTALVTAILRWGEQRGLHRIWVMCPAENAAAMRLLKRCGFRFSQYALPGIELDIELPVPFPQVMSNVTSIPGRCDPNVKHAPNAGNAAVWRDIEYLDHGLI